MDNSISAAIIIFLGFLVSGLIILKPGTGFSDGIEKYASQARKDLQSNSATSGDRSGLNKSGLYQRALVKVSRDFEESQINIPAARWFAILALISTALFVVLFVFLSLPFVLALLFGVVFGVLFHFYFLDRARKRIIKEFQEEFPEALMSISGAITAGLSFEQGLEASAQQGSSQLGKQFQRALNDMDLGASIEDALGQVAKRTKSTDMIWLIDAISISRETGTSIAPVLNTVASSIQDRAQLRREIQSLTAEGMLSAYVVVALPFVIFAFLIVTQPNYVRFFWTEPIGAVMGISALGLIGVGWLWLRTIVSVKE